MSSEESLDELGEVPRTRSRGGCLALLLLISAVPIGLLALAAVTGVGLARNLPTFPAFAAGLAMVLLPTFGLASLVGTGSRLAELGGCAWFWSLAVLLAMPFYFPGERSAAAAVGLELLTSPVAGESQEGLLAAGAYLVDLLGSEPEPTPFAGELPGAAAEAARAADNARRAQERGRSRGEVVMAYEGEGESMRIAAFVDGPRYGEEFGMIFDTGATYTTLNREALAQLEVPVPADAPIAVLRTANGEIEAPLVLVDAVWLGDAVVEWVTVAVCEPCATGEGVAGLLGLNVSGQFKVSLDHDHRQIHLGPRDGAENRKLDVVQWLGLRSRLLRWQDGRLEVEVTGENRSPVAIGGFSAEIDCPGGRFEVRVEGVEPRESRTRKMALPRGTECGEYTLSLREAAWKRERF